MVHCHWTVMAFRRRVPTPPELVPMQGKYRFDDFVLVKVDADNEKEALKKARESVKRKGYRVSEVYRCEQDHESTQDLRDEALVMQLEMQKQLLKKL